MVYIAQVRIIPSFKLNKSLFCCCCFLSYSKEDQQVSTFSRFLKKKSNGIFFSFPLEKKLLKLFPSFCLFLFLPLLFFLSHKSRKSHFYGPLIIFLCCRIKKFVLSLSLVRMRYTHTITVFLLNTKLHNLFLLFLPLSLSHSFSHTHTHTHNHKHS